MAIRFDVDSNSSTSAELSQPEPGFCPGQSGRGSSLVGVGQLLLEQTLGAMAGLLSTRFVDIVSPLSRIRQDRDLVGAYLEKSAGHEEQLLLAIVADSHRSGS